MRHLAGSSESCRRAVGLKLSRYDRRPSPKETIHQDRLPESGSSPRRYRDTGVALRAPACPPDDAIDHAGEQEHGNYDAHVLSVDVCTTGSKVMVPSCLHSRTVVKHNCTPPRVILGRWRLSGSSSLEALLLVVMMAISDQERQVGQASGDAFAPPRPRVARVRR